MIDYFDFERIPSFQPVEHCRGADRHAGGAGDGPRGRGRQGPRGAEPTKGPAGTRRGHGGDVRARRLAKYRQNVARFRLYRLRFLQENMRFAAFFKIYQII